MTSAFVSPPRPDPLWSRTGPRDIGWAMNALERGDAVRRARWPDGRRIAIERETPDKSRKDEDGVPRLIERPSATEYQPTLTDLLARDWVPHGTEPPEDDEIEADDGAG